MNDTYYVTTKDTLTSYTDGTYDVKMKAQYKNDGQ